MTLPLRVWGAILWVIGALMVLNPLVLAWVFTAGREKESGGRIPNTMAGD